jgi:hypothetical protein
MKLCSLEELHTDIKDGRIVCKALFEYDNQDQQGKALFNERNPTRPSNKNQWQRAQADPKQKQDRAQVLKSFFSNICV